MLLYDVDRLHYLHSIHCQGIDRNGMVNRWNANAERVFGHGENEMIGHHCRRFVRNEDLFRGENWSVGRVKSVRVVHANGGVIDELMVVEHYSDGIKFYKQREGTLFVSIKPICHAACLLNWLN